MIKSIVTLQGVHRHGELCAVYTYYWMEWAEALVFSDSVSHEQISRSKCFIKRGCKKENELSLFHYIFRGMQSVLSCSREHDFRVHSFSVWRILEKCDNNFAEKATENSRQTNIWKI